MNAPGAPGSEPRWTGGYKDGVGTAISSASPVWFSISHGILNEVYFPRLDTAAMRDGQLLVTDRKGGFWEEKRDLIHDTQYLDDRTPGFVITNREAHGRFTIRKRVFTWPRLPVLLQAIDIETDGDDYRWFYLLAPHLDNHGYGNSAKIDPLRDGTPATLVWRNGIYLCQTADIPLIRQSVGYVGVSDGWAELRKTGDLPVYDVAENGNLAVTSEWKAVPGQTQYLITSFGRTVEEAKFAAHLAINEDKAAIEHAYVAEWHHYFDGLGGILPSDHPHARMQRISAMVLKVHQDKIFSGGIIASLSIPWGNAAGDGNIGGYHLIWPRDMVEAANAFLTLDDVDDARLALDFLRASQSADGSWPQNFWLNGNPYWAGSQLDETAFPIHLAYQLTRRQPHLDVYPMVKKAMAYVATHGPVTQEERWEEDGGYSPSTLAAMIAGLILGGQIARENGDLASAEYVESLADYWAQSIDRWTFTEEGTAVPDHPRHYERIHPVADVAEDGNIHNGYVPIKNLPGGQLLFPEVSVIDGGFLELVRYGIKRADDPHIVESVEAYDAALKTEMPYGPVWHRYNHDGYGEGPNGEPYTGIGKGRAWPLLTGERGHYDLALGQSAERYLHAMEQAATVGGLIPEQVWDADAVPEHELSFGRPTGSASPLVWAHSEFLKLLHSEQSGHVFEQYAPVAKRYQHFTGQPLDYWQFNHQIQNWNPGTERIRVATTAPAKLIFTLDGWQTSETIELTATPIGCYYADVALNGSHALEFTFYWPEADRWEGKNFQIIADSL
jgi:glucoamylase